MIEPTGTSQTGTSPTELSRQTAGLVVPFRRETPSPVQSSTDLQAESPTPTFTWEALERQLTNLAVTPAQKALVETLVSATRKQAVFKPSELVLREMLCIAAVLMDETFHPDLEEGEMT